MVSGGWLGHKISLHKYSTWNTPTPLIQPSCEVNRMVVLLLFVIIIIIPILWAGKLRLREVQWLSVNHMAAQWLSQDNPGFLRPAQICKHPQSLNCSAAPLNFRPFYEDLCPTSLCDTREKPALGVNGLIWSRSPWASTSLCPRGCRICQKPWLLNKPNS